VPPSAACLVHLQTAVVFPQAVERPHCDRGLRRFHPIRSKR
jgi:hypothetical protein